MKYLLDTNVCIELLHDNANISDKIREVSPDNCVVSSVTMAELFYGAYNSNRQESAVESVRVIAELFDVIPAIESEEFGKIKASLRKKGTPIDDFDILIASTAIANNMILVSENVKHMSKIDGVTLENWMRR